MPLNVLPPVFGIRLNCGAAAIDFSQAAADRDLDFRRLSDRIAKSGDAAAVEGRADVHPVDLDGAFVATASARREEVGRNARADVRSRGLNTRNGRQKIAVPSSGGQRLDHALDSTTCFRVLVCTSTTGVSPVTVIVSERADPQVGVDGGDAGSGQLDAVAHDGRKARKRERDLVGSRRQILTRYRPVASVTAVRVFSINTGLDASTVTPGKTAPDASRTVPARDCASESVNGRDLPSPD